VLGAVIQGGLIRPIVRRIGDRPTFLLGLVFGAVGLLACTAAHSIATFALALVPLAVGIGFGHPTVASLVSLIAGADEQGRIQGAASAVESLGRTMGPIWGNASLEHVSESTPYVTAAAVLALTMVLSVGLRVGDRHSPPPSPAAV
jgi:DHA1 family tetracycline resistance protein-like MFS transporter